jgi:DNA-binding transcriptional ArsR family regulator
MPTFSLLGFLCRAESITSSRNGVHVNSHFAEENSVRELAVALAHPTRRAILRRMSDEVEWSPSDIGGDLQVPIVQAAYHMKVLAKNRAIEATKIVPGSRSIKHMYKFAIETDWALTALGLSKDSAS